MAGGAVSATGVNELAWLAVVHAAVQQDAATAAGRQQAPGAGCWALPAPCIGCGVTCTTPRETRRMQGQCVAMRQACHADRQLQQRRLKQGWLTGHVLGV